MNVPDKLYCGIQELDTGYVYALSLDDNGAEEYIRKDIVDETIKTAEDHAYFAGQEKFREKLMEWIQEARAIPHENAIARDLAFQEVVNHLNSM